MTGRSKSADHETASKIAPVMRLAPTVLVVCLLAATATAFAVSERLKLEESPVIKVQIDHLVSPVCTACPPNAHEAKIGFRLRHEDNIRLDIADSGGSVVRHGVGSGVFPASYRQFAWDGRDDSGRVVADGLYKAELRLLDEDRTFEFPDGIRVDATPPQIEEASVRPPAFSPDGDEHADHVDLRYRLSEPAYAILYVDGRLKGPSYRRQPTGKMQWYGRLGGAVLRPGEHRLALAAQDPAGNVAPSTREYTVTIRYVKLLHRRYVVRGRRLHVRVSTDATSVRWRLGGRSGKVSGRRAVHSLTLPVPPRAGRYRLAVTANGHRTRATVVVRR
jgi:hypothetical protein